MHKSPSELKHSLETLRDDATLPMGEARRTQAHRELAAACPAFVPNLLALSRSMLLSQQDIGAPGPYFAEVESTLRGAVDASGEDASALVELGHFLDTVRDAPQEAEALFTEASRRALRLLEASWAGLISVLGEQEKLDAALQLADVAQRTFPDSPRIREAVEFARQCAAR